MRVFNILAEGGKTGMPLQDTFWGAKFGMVTDKFGVNWMFNYDKAPVNSKKSGSMIKKIKYKTSH